MINPPATINPPPNKSAPLGLCPNASHAIICAMTLIVMTKVLVRIASGNESARGVPPKPNVSHEKTNRQPTETAALVKMMPRRSAAQARLRGEAAGSAAAMAGRGGVPPGGIPAAAGSEPDRPGGQPAPPPLPPPPGLSAPPGAGRWQTVASPPHGAAVRVTPPAKPVTAEPGQTPRSPVTSLFPVLVTVEPARTA